MLNNLLDSLRMRLILLYKHIFVIGRCKLRKMQLKWNVDQPMFIHRQYSPDQTVMLN